jgi:hypothetical protein
MASRGCKRTNGTRSHLPLDRCRPTRRDRRCGSIPGTLALGPSLRAPFVVDMLL